MTKSYLTTANYFGLVKAIASNFPTQERDDDDHGSRWWADRVLELADSLEERLLQKLHEREGAERNGPRDE